LERTVGLLYGTERGGTKPFPVPNLLLELTYGTGFHGGGPLTGFDL